MQRKSPTRLLKWMSLLTGGILFGGSCEAVFGTLQLVAGIVSIWV